MESFVINVNFHCVIITYPKIESELIQYVHTSVCKYLSCLGSGSITMHLWVLQHHLVVGPNSAYAVLKVHALELYQWLQQASPHCRVHTQYLYIE